MLSANSFLDSPLQACEGVQRLPDQENENHCKMKTYLNLASRGGDQSNSSVLYSATIAVRVSISNLKKAVYRGESLLTAAKYLYC